MNKFVIWGKGKLGIAVSTFIKPEWIDCFVDEHASENETISGIKVILPSNFWQSQYIKYPIIITPRSYEAEISKNILAHGSKFFFRFSEVGFDIEWIMKQLDKKYLLEFLKGKKEVVLYNDDIVSLLVGNILEENNFYVRYENDESKCIKSGEIKDFFSGSKYYYNKEIEQFKDLHKNAKRCFIIGTGPSLKMKDLDILKENNEICISVNSIIKAFDETKWRPNYYVISDPVATLMWKNEIENMATTISFIADGAWCFNNNKINVYKWHLKKSERVEPAFSDDFAKESFWGKTVIYDGALQLAVYMGFKEIILLGTDCSINAVSNESEHFYGNEKNQAEKSHLHIPEIFRAYAVAKKYADLHGIRIYNATRGGNLEIFERVDFDSLF